MRCALPFLAALALCATATGRADTPETAAQAAAGTWLALVDGGNYYQSWATASDRFRNSVSRTQWVQTEVRVREPLGLLRARQLVSATARHSLPGMPDGDYVVIEYRSSFANRASATETVTPVRDGDGRWRVSGYDIR